MPAKLISKQRAFDGFFSVDIVKIQPKSLRHDGYTAEMQREIFNVGEAVLVLLYNPKTDSFLLNQQFRVAAFLSGEKDPFLFETAAGLIDDGDTPEQTAHREVLEETGQKLSALKFIGYYFSSPGAIKEKVHLYIGCIKDEKAGMYGLENEGEEIKTHIVPAKKVFEMLDNNTIKNAMTALTLNWFARHYDEIRTEWSAL